ncbi:MAG: ABC transporter permease [Nevskiales bacterium]|nr:ABC transporter permease [Nevskiales bacterium]
MKHLPLVWAALWRKKTRTILTLLSIVVAFFLFGLLQGVNAAFNRGVELANVDRLVVINRIALTEQLPYAYMAQIDAVEGVRGTAFATWFGGYYQEPKNFIFAAPVDIDRYLAVVPEIVVDSAEVDAMKRTRTGALVGIEAMQKYGWKVGDHIPIHSTIWPHGDVNNLDWEFDIVGTYDFPTDRSQTQGMLFNHGYFDEARLYGKGTVGWYLVRVQDPTQAAAVAKRIDALFANSPNETKTQSEKEFSQSFLKQFGDINFIANAIIGAVFFTLLFLTGNTMMQSVRERIPELAILKTLGYSDGAVLTLVLFEALLMCVIAAGAGLALAYLAFPALKNYIGVATLPWPVIGTGLTVAALLAALVGLPPALHARRLNIVDALTER